MAPVLAVQALTGEGERLEPLSASALQLATMVGTRAWDRDAASRLIAYDSALSAKIRTAANAGASSNLGSADAAVSRLGQAKVVALALANCFRKPYSRAIPEFGLAADHLWRHSVATAAAVEHLQRRLAQPIPEECLAAALLHDLGYLVLARTLPADVQALLATESKQGWTQTRRSEQELAGTDHAHVGGAIAGHWGLPPVFIDTITHHHTPHQISTAHHAHVAYVVNIAEMVAATIGESLGRRESGPIDEAGTMLKLSIRGEQFSELCQEVYDDFEDKLYWYS